MDKTWQREWDGRRRHDNIRKILDVLKLHNFPHGSDSMQSLSEMATKFEETVFQSAESSDKYLSKIATKLAKVSAKMVPPGQPQMVATPPLHIPPGHMPVSQLGGGSQMLNNQTGQTGGANVLRSGSPSLYGPGSPGLPVGYSRGFAAQPNQGGGENTLPMGPAGGVPITALGMGGAPPGSFGLNPEQSRQNEESFNAYQQSVNKQQQQRFAPPQMPPNLTPQQQQTWMRHLQQQQQQQQRGGVNQQGQNQQFAPLQQYPIQGGGPQAQMLTPQQQQQQQQLMMQKRQLEHMQRQNQMKQGGAPNPELENYWQNLQQLKAKYLEPLSQVYQQAKDELSVIASHGKPENPNLKKILSVAETLVSKLQIVDRSQATVLMQKQPKGLAAIESTAGQLLAAWHKIQGQHAKKAQQDQHDARLQAQAALQERQKKEQDILRLRQQQQQETLRKQQQQQQHQQAQQAQQQQQQQAAVAQQAQALQRAQAAALKQAQQTGAAQGSSQQGLSAQSKETQSKILEQVLHAMALKSGMSREDLIQMVRTKPELKKRITEEVRKRQQRLAQQPSAVSLPPPTPPQPPAPPLAPKFDTFSPSPMPAQTPPLSHPTPPENFRASSPVDAYKPFSPDNFKAPTPPFQNTHPLGVPGKQVSASGGSVLTSPGGSVAGPGSPFTGSEGKPPLSGGSKLGKQNSLKGRPISPDIDTEDLPIASLRSQVSPPKENPLKTLAHKVWLLSRASENHSTLRQAASEIDQLVQLTSQHALIPRGVDSWSAKPENLVANTRDRLGAKRARGKQSVISIGVEGGEFDAESSISDANSCVDFQHSGDEAGSKKRARFGAQSPLEGEIDDVNRFLIDTQVVISGEGTRDAETEGRKGTAVICTYHGIGVNFPALRLLVPPSYPVGSPAVWHDYSAPGFSLPVAVSARENFSRAVRMLGAPLSVGAMARCWDQSVRDVIADVALSHGGGSYSNTVGVWMHCA